MVRMNPKLMIIDYYDTQIRHVDIYTEEQLAKYEANEITNEKSSMNQKTSDLMPKNKKIKLDNSEIDVCELLNRKRDEIIDKLRKCQEKTLTHYETIKNELKVLDKSSNEEMVEREITARLFEKNFEFVLVNTKLSSDDEKKPCPFNLFLIELDFYLSKHEKALLR